MASEGTTAKNNDVWFKQSTYRRNVSCGRGKEIINPWLKIKRVGRARSRTEVARTYISVRTERDNRYTTQPASPGYVSSRSIFSSKISKKKNESKSPLLTHNFSIIIYCIGREGKRTWFLIIVPDWCLPSKFPTRTVSMYTVFIRSGPLRIKESWIYSTWCITNPLVFGSRARATRASITLPFTIKTYFTSCVFGVGSPRVRLAISWLVLNIWQTREIKGREYRWIPCSRVLKWQAWWHSWEYVGWTCLDSRECIPQIVNTWPKIERSMSPIVFAPHPQGKLEISCIRPASATRSRVGKKPQRHFLAALRIKIGRFSDLSRETRKLSDREESFNLAKWIIRLIRNQFLSEH